MTSWLTRYLGASRINLAVYPASTAFDEWVRGMLLRCFPRIAQSPTPLRIRSTDMRWEYLSRAGQAYIIVDQELIETLAELDYFVSSNLSDLFIYVRLHLLLGDAFRKVGHRPLAMFCLTKAMEERSQLHYLRQAAIGSSGYSIPSVLALLHEMAHVALKQGDDYRTGWYSFIQESMESFREQLAQTLADEDLRKLEAITGLNLSDWDKPALRRQIENLLAAFVRNQVLYEELVCDGFAALTFINLKVPVDLLDHPWPTALPLSLRELGDLFYKAVVTISHMQYLAAVRQVAGNLARSEGKLAIGQELQELTIRHNVVIFLLNRAYQRILSQVDLTEPSPPAYSRLMADQQSELFLISVRHYIRQRNERLLRPLENIDYFFNEPTAFAEAFRETMATEVADYPSDYAFADYDELRRTCYTNGGMPPDSPAPDR